MTLDRLDVNNEKYFKEAFALYESAFPKEERRDIDEQQRAMKNKDYHFDLITDNGSFCGIMLYWETDNLIFLEHFAVLPELRGKGVGKCALEILKGKNKPILLEIEPPEDEITKRRYEFYKRNGFIMNPYHHIQAKYHLGDEDLELKIMSYPYIISEEGYRKFYEYMTREIGIRPSFSDGITIRPMENGDDIMQIAKLIYMTDPYIFPRWFDSIEQGQRVIAEMIKLPTLYNEKNITVAVDESGFIAGIAVSCDTPFAEDEKYIIEAFRIANVPCDSRTHDIFESYYKKMGDEKDGYYIANIAVDPDFRKRGIAASIVNYLLEDRNFCTLECITENPGTWRLYQRLGFKIMYEYPGVFSVPCYKMAYRR